MSIRYLARKLSYDPSESGASDFDFVSVRWARPRCYAAITSPPGNSTRLNDGVPADYRRDSPSPREPRDVFGER